jgi:hypothetical protein
LLSATLVPGFSSGPDTGFDDADCRVTSISFSVNRTPVPLVTVRRGDHVVVTFEVPNGCVDRMTFASFVAPAPGFDGSKLSQQALYSRASGAFEPGQHAMAVDVFGFPGSTITDCSAVPAPVPATPERHGENAKVTFSPSANDSLLHAGSCSGTPSQNGNGVGNARGKPCAGCVGNADDKNPPGQQPGGNDNNAGYECDRNRGVGKGNPAHSGCQNFQVDFSYRPSTDDQLSARTHSPRLIAAVFCVRASQVCYTTDRTGSAAVLGP